MDQPDPRKVSRHYSLTDREVHIIQCALTALASHPNGMGSIEPQELVDLSDSLDGP